MSGNVSHKIHKALKVRLYPSEEQKEILNKTFGCCRVVYNERLSEHILLSVDLEEPVEQNPYKRLGNLSH